MTVLSTLKLKALTLAMALVSGVIYAQPTTSIYVCITADGRRITADRYIDECRNREQKVLNRDGSVQKIIPPTLTAEEAAEAEARRRALIIKNEKIAEAARHERNLLARYPNEAAHQLTRLAATDTVRSAIKTTEQRLRELATERKTLEREAEFYFGKSLPSNLKSNIDANDAAVEAQLSLALNQLAELNRISRLYDTELKHLHRLWAVTSSLNPPIK